MKDLFKQENSTAFWVLAPFVCFAAAVLVVASVGGLAMLIIPGVLGFLGVAGLLECWVGLIRPTHVRRRYAAISMELYCGLVIGAFASLVCLGNVFREQGGDVIFEYLGAALIVHMPLSLLFLRAVEFVRQEHKAGSEAGPARSLLRDYAGSWSGIGLKIVGGFFLYVFILKASFYVPLRLHSGEARRIEAGRAAQAALESSGLVKNFCGGDAAAVKRSTYNDPRVRDSHSVTYVIDHCARRRSAPENLALILQNEALNDVDSTSGCTNLQDELLRVDYSSHDIVGLEEFTKRRLKINCVDEVDFKRPIWWMLNEHEQELTAADFEALVAMGIDLKQEGPCGEQFGDRYTYPNASNHLSPEVTNYLLERGVFEMHPRRC